MVAGRMPPMAIDCIDHIVLAVKSLPEASAPFERLGLTLTPPLQHRSQGTENRVFFVGLEGNEFYVELLAIHDRAAAQAAGRTLYLEAIDSARGVARVMLGVSDIGASVAELATRGVQTRASEVWTADNRKICDVAPIEGVPQMALDAGLVQYTDSAPERHARRAAAGRFKHAFPLKRLDHLAAIAPDIEASTRFWVDVLGVPVFGEIRGPGMIIRQFKIGDAILELLGPDGPESRLASRPPGLASMAAFEVSGGLDAAVALARERGFTPSEPNKGILPGTRVATIPPAELSGMGLQLLEYV